MDRSLDLWAITDLADDSDGLPAAIGIAIAAVVLAFILLPLVGIALELAFLDHPERAALFAVGGWQQSRRAIETLARRIPLTKRAGRIP